MQSSIEQEAQKLEALKNKQFFTKQEAAFYLNGISVGHIDNLIRKKGLPAIKIGRLIRIKREALDQWVNEQTGI